MSELIGLRIGVYQVEALIGSGGMGEVYRARDTRLGRDVAIKILPRPFAADRDRLARFEREARVLASLNHPHIGAIYGLEESAPVGEAEAPARALVLELVDGETLANRIASGPLAVEQALAIADQIADALDAAHEKGVVHRDLKPANIKITPDGLVKVLDFGLARTIGDAPAELTEAGTVTAAGTGAGTILGTVAYMSPEQARGQPVDRRTDIWAFACVLYEMLTARRAFAAETVSDSIAAILGHDPDWSALPPGTPAGVTRLLRRALQKEAKQRLRDIGDARLELQEAAAPPAVSPTAHVHTGRSRVVRWTAAGVLAAAAAGALGYYGARQQPPRAAAQAPAHFAVELPLAAPQLNRGRGSRVVALSPDGRSLAFIARASGQAGQLWVRSLDRLESHAVAGTGSAFDPFFSPDGRWIGYFDGAQIKKVLATGGEPLIICDIPSGEAVGASWAPDDTIFFTPSPTAGLWRVPAAGGTPEAVLTDPGVEYRAPQLVANGKAVVFASLDPANPRVTDRQIFVQSLETRERRVLVQGSEGYLADGHLLFVRGNSLLAAEIDPETFATGPPLPMIDRVAPGADSFHVSVSSTSSLAYVPPLGKPDGTLAWVERNGTEQSIAAPVRPYGQPRLSANVSRIAVTIEPLVGQTSEVWTYDLSRDVLAPAVAVGRISAFPAWAPDALRLTFQSAGGMYSKPIDAAGPEMHLAPVGLPMAWAPDGRMLAYVVITQPTMTDIWLLPFDDRGQPQLSRPFVQGRLREGGAAFSPDGRWVAYVSNETGRNEIHVRSVADGGGQHQISIDGGSEVVWPRRSRELFYRSGDTIMAVDVSTSPALVAGRPRPLFKGQFIPSTALWANYDVTPDGQRFLMIKPATPSQARPQVIHMMLNWPEELRRRASVR